MVAGQTYRQSKRPSYREFAAICGFAMFAAGLLYLFSSLQGGPPRYAYHPHEHVSRPAQKETCDIKSDLPNHRLTVNQSFIITVHVSLPQEEARQLSTSRRTRSCDSKVEILAAAFDVKPDKEEFHLPDAQGNTRRDFLFNLMPTHSGTQTVVVSYERGHDSLEYEVDDERHIPEAFSRWFGVIGTFLGPLLSVPYWIDLYQKRREGRLAQNSTTAKTK